MANTIKKIHIKGSDLQYDYNSLANTPTIPSTVAELTDAGNYATTAYVESKISALPIDTEISSSSTNPVQNKVIKEYIDEGDMYPIAYKTYDGYGTVSAYTSDGNYSIIDLNSMAGICWISRDCNKLSFSPEFIALDFSRADTRNITNTSMLCAPELTSLDLSYFDTSNVTDMSYMFSCSGYEEQQLLALSIIGASSSFIQYLKGCYHLESLDVSNFDTSNVTNMAYMFNGCLALTSLDVSNFDTTNVTNMGGMFNDCSKLTSLDLSSFDTTNVADMSFMFNGCSKLTSLDVSNFDTTNVTNMGDMFSCCYGLTSLDLSSFDTTNVTNMGGMFNGCFKLTSLDLSSFEDRKSVV